MTRFIPIAALVLVAASCGDQSTAPSPLQPGAAASADRFGDPPPPPAGADDGFGNFSTEESFAAQAEALGGPSATELACTASSSFGFKYKYLINPQNNNAFLHINPQDESKHVTIHQTDKQIDAHGVLSGPGFTFKILEALFGSIINPEQRVPGGVSVTLRGILTTETGTCTATGTLNASLTGDFEIDRAR